MQAPVSQRQWSAPELPIAPRGETAEGTLTRQRRETITTTTTTTTTRNVTRLDAPRSPQEFDSF